MTVVAVLAAAVAVVAGAEPATPNAEPATLGIALAMPEIGEAPFAVPGPAAGTQGAAAAGAAAVAAAFLWPKREPRLEIEELAVEIALLAPAGVF